MMCLMQTVSPRAPGVGDGEVMCLKQTVSSLSPRVDDVDVDDERQVDDVILSRMSLVAGSSGLLLLPFF